VNLVHPGCPSLVAMHDGSSKGGGGSFTRREGMPLSHSFLPRLCCLHPVLPRGPWILSTPSGKGAIRRGAGRGGDRSSTSVEPTTTYERPSTLNPPPGSGRGAPWGRAGGEKGGRRRGPTLDVVVGSDPGPSKDTIHSCARGHRRTWSVPRQERSAASDPAVPVRSKRTPRLKTSGEERHPKGNP